MLKSLKLTLLIFITMGGCGCEECNELGLSVSYIPYNAYASDSSGSNFSLGTPLSSSKYIAWVSIASTAGTPVAADFAGLWTAYYGSNVLGNTYFNVTSTLTTEETLGTMTGVIPAALTKDSDVVRILVDYLTLTNAATSKVLRIKVGGVTINALTDISGATEQFGFVECILSRTSSTTFSVRVIDNFYDTTRLKTRELWLNNVTATVPNLDNNATTILVTATCGTAPNTLTLGRVTVEIDRY